MEKLLLAAISITAKEIGVPTSTGTLDKGLANVVTLMMSVIGSLSIIFIIVGGIIWITANGTASRITRGRETVLYAVVGLVVSIAALAIVTFISNSVK